MAEPSPARKGAMPSGLLQAAITIASGWSRLTHLAVGFGSVGLLAAADLVSGPHISLAVFYLLPLALVGWFTSRPWAVALATIAGFAWFMDFRPLLPQGMPTAVIVWACCSRVGMCLATAWLIGALREMYDQQRTLAGTDEVTGIANRRTFLEITQRELARCARTHEPISVIYLDADRFKAVNDLSGHAEGDRLLCAVARTLTDNSRKTDACARLGGDEFAVLLPDADAAAARMVADKLRVLLQQAMLKNRWPVTFSIGVATFTKPPAPHEAEHLLRAADELQYAAKHGGRDTIVAAAA
jgi:diguanylate cyclase (GGDEF)-like protein